MVVTPLGGEHEYGVWREVTIIAIEMSVGASGCKEGKSRWKLGNSSALVAQSTLIIKKNFVRLVLG